ncbi:hypothetical protein [Nostoc sp. MS1]|uniref:hypothetical protein n=1 Tax=Nostoc sp. MS1 TaxID=2764711 RepID=UPI001CC4AA48|nr:hypothetical protein [Nostoc sp. MS1]BCL40132.1 hypothetical protein NSMS1_65790 [Nostoc sp. MS1]
MKVIVQVVETVVSEAHLEIPDELSPDAIKQYITDRYNSGQMQTDFNICQVDFQSINAQIVKTPQE